MPNSEKKTPIGELCDQALEHYIQISNEACHYNSLVPEAIKFYKRFHTPNAFDESLYEPPRCEHNEKHYLSELTNGLELWRCNGCPYLFTKEGGVFREPDPKDWEDDSL